MDASADHPVMWLTLDSVFGKCFLFLHTLVESVGLTPKPPPFEHETWCWTNCSEGGEDLVEDERHTSSLRFGCVPVCRAFL